MKPKKSFGAEIDAELADTLTDYVDHIGCQKYRAVEAGLRMFLLADIETQWWAMMDKSSSAKELVIDKRPKSDTKELSKNIRLDSQKVRKRRKP